eukprot:2347285-Pyramimonas_sp.AAC.1
MSCMRPRAQGRSLAVLSLLEKDPCWRVSVAPILRCAKEIWLCHARAFRWCLSWAELREGWALIFQRDDLSWAKVRGPVSALRMCSRRLGWTMPDFTSFKDDFCRGTSMTLTSPPLLPVCCRGAVFRNLERESGERYGVGHRLCWDVF